MLHSGINYDKTVTVRKMVRNKSMNQVHYRKVLKRTKKNLVNQLFITAMIGLTASSSPTL